MVKDARRCQDISGTKTSAEKDRRVRQETHEPSEANRHHSFHRRRICLLHFMPLLASARTGGAGSAEAKREDWNEPRKPSAVSEAAGAPTNSQPESMALTSHPSILRLTNSPRRQFSQMESLHKWSTGWFCFLLSPKAKWGRQQTS